jgi:hypothetical protein
MNAGIKNGTHFAVRGTRTVCCTDSTCKEAVRGVRWCATTLGALLFLGWRTRTDAVTQSKGRI